MAARSLIGTRVDRYEVIAQVGQGGFGAVYRARHTVLGTDVALKVLWPDHAGDPRSVERFLREARTSASVGSPHIVKVLDAGVTETGAVFLAMELLEGRDLARELAARGRLSVDEGAQIARQTLRGLAAAHRAGIVHRDLKPANVFVIPKPEPLVKLLDFGISKVAGAHSLTASGLILGTPQYMAPEQIERTDAIDGRADLYAVGAILYELWTGQVPFEGEGFQVLVRRVQGENPPPLRERAPHVSEALALVVQRALAADRDARWPNADAMLEALEYAHAGRAIATDAEATLPPQRASDGGGYDTVPDERPPVEVVAIRPSIALQVPGFRVPATTPPSASLAPPIVSRAAEAFVSPPHEPVAASESPPFASAPIATPLPSTFANGPTTPNRAAHAAPSPSTPTGPPTPSFRDPADSPVGGTATPTAQSAPGSTHPAVFAAFGGLAILLAITAGAVAVGLHHRFGRAASETPSAREAPPIERQAERRPSAPPTSSGIAPGAVEFTNLEIRGNTQEPPLRAFFEEAREAVAACGQRGRSIRVSVFFPVSHGGFVPRADPSPTRPSDDPAVAACVARAIASPLAVDGDAFETGQVTVDVILDGR